MAIIERYRVTPVSRVALLAGRVPRLCHRERATGPIRRSNCYSRY